MKIYNFTMFNKIKYKFIYLNKIIYINITFNYTNNAHLQILEFDMACH